MLKTSTIAVCVLAISASAAAAQSTLSVPAQGKGVDILQYDRQQAMAPVSEDRSNRTFIYDEFGNLYDGHGQRITARPAKLTR